MEHVSQHYEARLRQLAHLLCPIQEVVQINLLSIPREEQYSFQHDVEDTQTGFDDMGNYHHPSLRTEHIESPVQLNGQWEL